MEGWRCGGVGGGRNREREMWRGGGGELEGWRCGREDGGGGKGWRVGKVER